MADTSLTEIGPPPRSAGELFLVFAWILMQSCGGALTFIEKTVVQDKCWLDLTRFRRHISASSTKLLDCPRAQQVKMTVPADSIVETLNVIKHV